MFGCFVEMLISVWPLQKPHFLERASVVMVDHESGLTRAPTDNLEHHSLEFKDTHDAK